jgi:OmpA-OmpF porin, OOP family
MKYVTMLALLSLLSLLSLSAFAAMPDKDTDRDGIKDANDYCDSTPKKSVVDAYGCQTGDKVAIAVDVNFAKESVVVNDQYRGQIQHLANYLKANPKIKVELKGYADKTGTVEQNKTLALRRAEAIRTILVESYDIKSNRLTVTDIGETTRSAPHKGIEGEYRNRRVEARVIEEI